MIGRTRRGLALIVVLGALFLMALLAATLAATSALERTASRNYLDAVRARLLASSGVEEALARMGAMLAQGGLPPPVIAFTEGPASGSYAPGGDHYEVRATDANARLNVNDGLAWGPDHAVSRNLRRLLNVLGAQPGVDVPGLGDRLLGARPPSGYVSIHDLLPALDHDREAFGRVRDFLTASSWSDPNVALLVPLSVATEPLYPVLPARPRADGGAVYRYGHQKNVRGEQVRVPLAFADPAAPGPGVLWGRDSLNPQWIEIVSRSPVNVNAARRELLVALLTDLEGFFVLERPRPLEDRPSPSPCRSPGGAYGWTALRYTYDSAGAGDGGDCGGLYRTRPLAGPGGRHSSGISAAAVADEIVACRERKQSPLVPALNYGRAPFGGPFRTWAQFNRFADALVEGGLLVDDRFPGEALRRLASQAVADALKANFNPNLHLNEINPDRTLFAHVDKTDLLCQSTEFSFTPMGTFEIESTGRVTGPDGSAIAEHPVAARVRLFDAVRETSQAQFARGSFAPRRPGPETNNNRSVESGPEPDNGPAPLENRYEGYLQLPTYGSNLTGDDAKPMGELWTTITDPAIYPGAVPMPPGGRHLGASIHAHFQLDHAAHHHAGRNGSTSPPDWEGFRLPQGAWQTVIARRCCLNRNWEDRTETLASPYSPPDTGRAGETGQRFRLARSFTSYGAPPGVREAASSDLRLDGAYVERHSAFGYWIDESESFNFNEGTVAFWMKPGFFPETTGKRRTLLSAGRYHAAARELMNPSPFGLFLTPAFDAPASGAPSYAAGMGMFRPLSLAFGLGFSTSTGYNWETTGGGAENLATHHAFALTPPLQGLLRAHEWMHLAVAWRNRRNALPGEDSLRILVNGKPVSGTAFVPHLYEQEGQPFQNTPRWTTHSLQATLPGIEGAKWVKNSIRIGGEPSLLFDLPGGEGLFPANFSADATFDEFYLWLDRSPAYNGGLWGAQQLWSRGRYYRPDDANLSDARYTSAPVILAAGLARALPPPAPTTNSTLSAPARFRLLGAAWTALGGDVQLFLQAEGPLRDAGWSSPGRPLPVDDPAAVRWSAKLLGGPGTALLASPVLDDVTLYFDRGGADIVAWVSGR